jgi:hypothetical protein
MTDIYMYYKWSVFVCICTPIVEMPQSVIRPSVLPGQCGIFIFGTHCGWCGDTLSEFYRVFEN